MAPELSNEIKFGTDGWRAIIADDYTFANVRICAQATAAYLQESGLASKGVVVGYDTRFSSEHFAAAAAEVLAANGITVYLASEAAPTPVVGYAILTHKAGGAVMITASHNPGDYNGFKIRTEYAGSAPPEILAQIEAKMPAAAAYRTPGAFPSMKRAPAGSYTISTLARRTSNRSPASSTSTASATPAFA